jgi:DNA-binding SARP family transcriptional activator
MFAASLEICLAETGMEARSEEADKALLDATEIMTLMDELERFDELPVSESSNDGYWWNKQDRETKTQYIKQLIELFEAEDKKLKVKKIIKELDSLYDPKDDPLDIKIDLSVERMFNEVIK